MLRVICGALLCLCVGATVVGCGQSGALTQRPGAPSPVKAAGINGLTAYSLSGVS